MKRIKTLFLIVLMICTFSFKAFAQVQLRESIDSTFSEGNGIIVIIIAVIAVLALAYFVVKKKKNKK